MRLDSFRKGSMSSTARWIWVRRLLFVVVANLGLAIGAVFMPSAWMEQIAKILGVGPLTDNGLVHYLARQTSALYVLHAATIAIIAVQLPRSLPMIVHLGFATLGFSALTLYIDWVERMPTYWMILEPAAIFLGGVSLIVAGRWAAQESISS
jgi:hypothetical protein